MPIRYLIVFASTVKVLINAYKICTGREQLLFSCYIAFPEKIFALFLLVHFLFARLIIIPTSWSCQILSLTYHIRTTVRYSRGIKSSGFWITLMIMSGFHIQPQNWSTPSQQKVVALVQSLPVEQSPNQIMMPRNELSFHLLDFSSIAIRGSERATMRFQASLKIWWSNVQGNYRTTNGVVRYVRGFVENVLSYTNWYWFCEHLMSTTRKHRCCSEYHHLHLSINKRIFYDIIIIGRANLENVNCSIN